MTNVVKESWRSLTCKPNSGLQVRTQLEDILYASGCEGLWDHILDNYDDLDWPESESLKSDELFAVDNETESQALLTAYFPESAKADLYEISLKITALGLVDSTPQIKMVKNEDWLEKWRQNFTITELTEKTLVVPTWQKLPEGEMRLGLRIYPGQGFGTGTHETTRLAAGFLEDLLLPLSSLALAPVSVLDVGTGSGILAILAVKRGADKVVALDIDEDALINARENCGHNLVADRVVLNRGALLDLPGEFDLVVANIIVPVLRRLAPDFSSRIKPGGHLILSGILCEQLPEIEKIYSELGYVVKESRILGEWAACLLGTD